MKIAGTKVTGCVRLVVDRAVGEHVARSFFDRKYIVSSQNFDFVWWDGVENGARDFPKMF